MLFTWNTHNACVVFQWWRVRNAATLALTILGIIGLGLGYEFIREFTRRFERMLEARQQLKSQPSLMADEHLPLLRRLWHASSFTTRSIRAFLYAFQVFYSFFLMLVFMTYNGVFMFALTFGAFLGFYIWGNGASTVRGSTCH
ncbi:Ctr copper transporter [Dipodascopsis tothii]|uniref:Ctr copper transporter n=1 Tax=Dipodascopsis tothii TaxID=44089 RepID=UPI0034CF9CD7